MCWSWVFLGLVWVGCLCGCCGMYVVCCSVLLGVMLC